MQDTLRNIGYRQKCKNAAVSFLPEISAMLVVETHAQQFRSVKRTVLLACHLKPEQATIEQEGNADSKVDSITERKPAKIVDKPAQNENHQTAQGATLHNV